MQVGARPDDDTRPIVGPSRSLATHPSRFIDMTPPYRNSKRYVQSTAARVQSTPIDENETSNECY